MNAFYRASHVVAALLLLLLVVLPFTNPWHFPPWYTYHSELGAVYFAGLLVGVLALTWRRWSMSVTAFWCWAGALLLLLQIVLMDLAYQQSHWFGIGELLLAGCLASALVRWREAWGAERVLTTLAAALVAGLVISAFFGWLQRTGLYGYFPGWVLVMPGDNSTVVGNVGQRNLYAHYVMWGHIATAYLLARFHRWWWLLLPLVLWSALEVAIIGSRTVVAYYLVWLLVAVPGWWVARTPLQRRFAVASVLAVCFGMLMQFVGGALVEALYQQLGISGKVLASVDRIAEKGLQGDRRLDEWHKAWLAFKANPWFGVGFNHLPGESFRLHALPAFAGKADNQLWTHSHNGVLQILAELGLLGLAWLGGLLALLVRAIRRWQSDVTVFMLPLVLVSLTHSLLEYPLWYAHFFLLFVAYLALAETPLTWRPQFLHKWVGVAIGVVLLGAIAHPVLFHKLTQKDDAHVAYEERLQRADWLKRAAAFPLMDYQAESALVRFPYAQVEDISQRAALTARLMRYRPFPSAVYWRGCALGWQGKWTEFADLQRRLQLSYPYFVTDFRADWLRYGCVDASRLLPQQAQEANHAHR